MKKTVEFAGVACGVIYFGVGLVSCFTLNGIDFWSTITLLSFTFLLPLPIAVVAFWYPRLAGVVLLSSVCLCVTILICLSGIKDTFTASPGLKFYIPNLILASVYLVIGWTSKQAGTVNGGSPFQDAA